MNRRSRTIAFCTAFFGAILYVFFGYLGWFDMNNTKLLLFTSLGVGIVGTLLIYYKEIKTMIKKN